MRMSGTGLAASYGGGGRYWYEAQGMSYKKIDVFIGRLKVLIDFDLDDLAIVRSQTPVLSGTLRAGWVIEGNYLSNYTYYAGFVEFGHRTVSGSWVPGQFFAQRAADLIARRYAERVGKYIETHVQSIFSKGEMTIRFKMPG